MALLYHFDTLEFHHSTISAYRHFTILPFHHWTKSPIGHFTTLLFYHSTISPLNHLNTKPFHHSTTITSSLEHLRFHQRRNFHFLGLDNFSSFHFFFLFSRKKEKGKQKPISEQDQFFFSFFWKSFFFVSFENFFSVEICAGEFLIK